MKMMMVQQFMVICWLMMEKVLIRILGIQKNIKKYKISYERSIERAGNSNKKTEDFNQYKSMKK